MKVSIPKGTRDFSPDQVRKRNYIFQVITDTFIRYGYQPIETPTMENLSTLTGKYGEEGDKLLFKVLNNGDFLKKADENALEARDSARLISSIARRGLRYDLTVPFARYVVMHQNEINFPFKRYQIQPVWRADRPQKGRYQEFYQCDADVVGSDSLMYEAEFVKIYDEVFRDLGIAAEIKVNNRKILAGMAEAVGISSKFVEMTTAIDKLDKIGIAKVKEEMHQQGIPESATGKMAEMLSIKYLDSLEKLLADSTVGLKGVEELRCLHNYLDLEATANEVKFDISLARGLNYYTGCIFEVQAKGVNIGSIGGGGRYDDLTGVFGLKDVSGVGISFGAARIFDIMEELDLYPKDFQESLKLLLIAFDKPTHIHAFRYLNQIRKAGINAELYPEPVKLKKQMKYANARGVPYVALIGEEEMKNDLLSLKDMHTGDQAKVALKDLIDRLV